MSKYKTILPRWLDFQKALLGLRHGSMGVISAKQKPARFPASSCSQLRGLLASKSRFWDRDKGKARAGGRGQGRNDKLHFCVCYLEPAGLWHRWLRWWEQQSFLKNGTMDFMWCLIDSSDQQGKEIEDLRSNSTEMPSSKAFGFPRACQVGGCTARFWNPHWGSLPARSSFKIIVKKCSSLLWPLSWLLKDDFTFIWMFVNVKILCRVDSTPVFDGTLMVLNIFI